jgi:hypothetical protein
MKNKNMSRSKIGLLVFGLVSAYSLFILLNGSSPGILLIVGIVGFILSLGDYLSEES